MIDMVTVRTGSKGRIVVALQRALQARGEVVSVDGVAGPQTMRAAARVLGLPEVAPLSSAELSRLGVPLVYGIDLSGHNEGGNKPEVDFQRVHAAGIRFCYLKLTEGTSYRNREATRQASECRRYGIAAGGYHFADPSARRALDLVDLGLDAKAEADHYVEVRREVFGKRGPQLFDMLDLERTYRADLSAAAWAAIGGTSRRRAELAALWCLSWRAVVKASTGAAPAGLYTGKWAWDAYLKAAPEAVLAELRASPLWLASYNTGAEPARQIPGYPWAIWQYSGSGSVPGVTGKCDLNVMLEADLASLRLPLRVA